jgi:hypothetical protein
MIGFGMSLGRADRLGQPRLSEGAQPYLVAELWHDFQVPGPGHQVSGSGNQVQVLVPGPDPNLITRTWRQKPVTRDPKYFQPLTANR